jgi:manganese/zinc/iron transport system permease protein
MSAGPGSLDALPSPAEVLAVLSFRGGFNTNAVIAGTMLLGLAAGVVGVFALLRRRALVADAISHATLPGVVGAFFLAGAMGLDGRSLPVLLAGAAVSGVLGSLAIQAITRYTRLHEDAAIGIVLSVFFGAGVVLLSLAQSGHAGSAAGLNRFIYGQTAAMTPADATLMGGIALSAVLFVLALGKELALVCFDDGFARAGGWPVGRLDLVIMALLVVVTAGGLQAVGLLLVIALLIIPPVAARFWTDRLPVMIALSAGLGALGGYAGSAISSLLPGQPAGAVIVLVCGAVFLVSMLLAPRRGVLARARASLVMRLRMAADHLLEAAHDAPDPAAIPPEVIRDLARRRGWPRGFRPLLLRWLTLRGFFEREPGGRLRLTGRGRAGGARVSRNHLLWSQYLISLADVDPGHVDWSVDRVEHVLTPEQVHRLEDLLKARGVRIPDAPAGAGGSR